MDPTIEINQVVDMITVYRAHGSELTRSMPSKMRYKGEDINFTKLGMRFPTEKGRRMVHVFEMSDGVNDYRIEYDAERLTWTLISMIGGEYV